jgi:hypothetical protein
MRRAWVVIAMVLGAVTSALPAEGKSPYSFLRTDEYERVGAHVVAKESLYSHREKQLRRWVAGGPYYAYISRGWDRRWRQVPPLPEDAQLLAPVSVGPVEKEEPRWWSVELRAEFTLEGYRPGRYRIDVCTSPCQQTIKELYPSTFRIVGGQVEERIQKGLDDLSFDTDYLLREVNLMRTRVRGASKGFTRFFNYAREEFAEQSTRIRELESALARVAREPAAKPFPAGIAMLAFLVGALSGGVGWFFGPRLALRARIGRKKPPAPSAGATGESPSGSPVPSDL